MSKGSQQRPGDKAAFDSGYERIFGQQAKSEAALQAMVDFSQEHGLYDLYEDVASKLRYEKLTRSEQHQQLERIASPTLTGKISLTRKSPFPGQWVHGNLPAQTCGNCRHWERYEPPTPGTLSAQDPNWERNGICSELYGFIDCCGCGGGFHPQEDFSCNRWEPIREPAPA